MARSRAGLGVCRLTIRSLAFTTTESGTTGAMLEQLLSYNHNERYNMSSSRTEQGHPTPAYPPAHLAPSWPAAC